ncbi:MAG: GDP-L-fucose synthase [Minisyncoccia bacterium]
MKKDEIDLKNSKILLTGGHGFLGQTVFNELIRNGAKEKNIFRPRSKELDLRIQKNCEKAVKEKDIIIHLAATVGGIGFNKKFPGTLFYDNAVMGIHLIEEARKAKVKKFVQVGTVCAYPKIPIRIPFREEDIWIGYPEETNAPYGLAKKMLVVQLEAYRQQYGFNGINPVCVNLYGPGDNFHPDHSHVIPALIKRFVEAKGQNKSEVVVWGTGKASREFLYVDDAARAIVLATIKHNDSRPINIGSNFEIKIKDLVKIISKIVGFNGKVVWDKTKPDGQPRRKLDVSKAKKEFGFVSKIDFETGLRKTINWYINNHSKNLN